MNAIKAVLFVAVACMLTDIKAQSGDPAECHVQQKCGECQAAGPHCKWCSDTGFGHTRCDLADNLASNGCQDVTSVRGNQLRVTEARPLSNDVYVTPQRIRADLFKNHSITFPVTLRIPEGFQRSKVIVRVKRPPSGITATISSRCRGTGISGRRVSCPVTGPGQTLEFRVTMLMTECGRNTRMRIKASGIPGNTRVDISKSCICGCEFYSVMASSEPAEFCNDNGETLCGLCHCYPGYSGERCECRSSDSHSRCMAEGSSEICSGRGECVCGQCYCNQGRSTNATDRFTGMYCECDDRSCPITEGQMCGGEGRGQCRCGQCVCEDGYTGDGCEMTTATDTCVSIGNGLLCNGHGMCISGRCQCDGVFMGPTCEECPTCIGRCASLKPCVQCWAFHTGPLSREECDDQCTPLDITLVDDIDDTNLGTSLCQYRDEDGGMLKFAYIFSEDGSMVVLVNEVKACIKWNVRELNQYRGKAVDERSWQG